MFAPTLHPLNAAIVAAEGELASVANLPVYGLSEAQRHHAEVEVHRLRAQVDELELRLAAESAAQEVDVKTVWVRETHQTPRAAGARLELARALEHHEPVRAAMTTGAVTEAQASVVVASLDALPSTLGSDLRTRAEAHMIGLCTDHHPDELHRLGKHLLRVVAPDLAEAEEARQVDEEYRRSLERAAVRMVDRHDGTWEGRFVLPALHAHLLRKLLMAFAAPRHVTASGQEYDPGIPTARRLGLALCELLERYPTDRTPDAGGIAARGLVTLTLDDLTARLHDDGIAWVDEQVTLPAWEARRMACEAGLIPAVLNGRSEILDLGRTRRLHTEPQRIAIHHRDHTCRADGCDWPAAMSHIHHAQPWSHGGSTNLSNAMTLCPKHHRRAHDPTYEMSTSKNGRVVFRRT